VATVLPSAGGGSGVAAARLDNSHAHVVGGRDDEWHCAVHHVDELDVVTTGGHSRTS
jgi:hypothetical protein